MLGVHRFDFCPRGQLYHLEKITFKSPSEHTVQPLEPAKGCCDPGGPLFFCLFLLVSPSLDLETWQLQWAPPGTCNWENTNKLTGVEWPHNFHFGAVLLLRDRSVPFNTAPRTVLLGGDSSPQQGFQFALTMEPDRRALKDQLLFKGTCQAPC